jgi:outer membrane protein OmpA-like peptidoglycan-associated protein
MMMQKTLAVRGRTALALLVTPLVLVACLPSSYVVLLPDADGKVGRVLVQGDKGKQELSKAGEGAALTGDAGKAFTLEQKDVERKFAGALAATAQRPQRFLLQFESGGATLTPASQALLPKVLEEVRNRPAPDISVIGHTDTVGAPEGNVALGLTRAQFVAGLVQADLNKANLQAVAIDVTSHGESNLLVRTADEVDEPRNRRVEVTVR